MRDWQLKGLVDYQAAVCVNLSGKQFAQPGMLEQVRDTLNETGLRGECLELEITESVIMENADAACETMLQLRALGVSLSMDDFGTGYSSLSYLHRFPISALKIDRSFIGNDDNSGIVGTIITLADKLGMEVIAEGVETAAQVAYLKDLGCEFGQGYWLARPGDSAAIELLLQKDAHQTGLKASLPLASFDPSRPIVGSDIELVPLEVVC